MGDGLRDDATGVMRRVRRDTIESATPLLEKKLETSVPRSADQDDIHPKSGDLPVFRV